LLLYHIPLTELFLSELSKHHFVPVDKQQLKDIGKPRKNMDFEV